ncbi:MAG TPA: spore germination protein GerPB [Bacillus sp. (in: firmicutes)]|uniref:spore germination protein GerPB n=1 Tax=Bacillus litorisediminis TaxID=2922713 RepID=UPI001FAC7617|nr:spore germination protein GerPB [Bacillus litorisediminis]HWO75074.1 spore germination protein GerPB [Bacillus sp. (in: firmicutes)]
MNFYIQQSIYIHILRVGSVTNSSVLQIGSSGSISANAYLYNTGGYVLPAPEADAAAGPVTQITGEQPGVEPSLVPLGAPTQ